MAALISTKNHLPLLVPQHIHRPHLLAELRPTVRLLLISAPAGYGKTSALVEWCHRQRAQQAEVAWYALDANDNDPARFGAYLVSACGLDPSAFSPADIEGTVVALLNHLAARPTSNVIVLDDYHLINSPAVHSAVGLLLEHLPANTLLAIGSRADPPLQLSRLRARGQMRELRAVDLRFTQSEIQAFIGTQAAISVASAADLHAATEGWAAVLQLIALALADMPDRDTDRKVGQVLARFSRTQGHIYDYFADEIFALQSPEIQEFLLDTCILNRLNTELCCAVTGRADAGTLISRVARSGLFLGAIDETGTWYRYHHLFQDFLRARLRLQGTERSNALHRYAAEWYAENGFLVEAVEHALEANQPDSAAWLIETQVWEALSARAEITTVLNWLPAFHRDVLLRHPRLCLYFARAQYLIGQIGAADDYLNLAAEALDEARPEDGEALRAVLLNYRATLAGYHGAPLEGLRLLEDVPTDTPGLSSLDRTRVNNTLGHLHFLTGNISAARPYYTEAARLAQEMDHDYLMLDSISYLTQIDLLAGNLTGAQARCEPLLQGARPITPLCAIMLPLAQIYYEQDDIAKAEAMLHQAIDMARRGSITDVWWTACMRLASVFAVQGRTEEAMSWLAQGERLSMGYRGPHIATSAGALRARVMLITGDLNRADEWAHSYRLAAPTGCSRADEDLTLARVYLATGLPERALPVLQQVSAIAGEAGRYSHVMEADTLHALASAALGKPDSALNALESSLALAVPAGYVRLFLDLGQPMLALLRQAVNRQIPYAEALYRRAAHQPSPEPSVHPADMLSEREREVLHLIALGASNQDISERLVISTGTVKSHINHIMGKLQARNRTEAVAKARQQGLLD